jgi:hypothetical protein
MWFQSLSPWLLTVAMVSQVGAGPAVAPPALPEMIPWRRAEFDMSFVIERSNDPSWQPVEAQLYFSTDRGAHWRLHTTVPVEQRYFKVRTSGDGEYWFAIRTVNRSGQGRPATISAPARRILVDTKPPVLKLTAQPGRDGQVTVRWEIDELNLKSKSLNIVYRPSPTEPWQAVAIERQGQSSSDSPRRGEATFWPKPGSTEIPIRAEVSDTAGNPAVASALVKLDQRVGPRPAEESAIPKTLSKGTVPFSSNENRDSPANDPAADVGPALTPESKGDASVGGNPAIGKRSPTLGDRSDAGPTLPVPPPSERPRMVNSRTFELEYDVDAVGPSGIGRVELWGTRDGGQTWRSFAVDTGKRSPLQVSVKEEGAYGFRVVVSNGAGVGGKPPVAGDPPDLTIGVDLTKPTARIVSAKQGVDSEAGQLIISWQADDQMLAARPVSLSFSENRSGPWLPIAAGLENSGRYAWPLENRTPAKVYMRLEVRDEAGNVATHETTEPIVIDQSHPTVRIRSVRPVSQPIGSAMRPR